MSKVYSKENQMEKQGFVKTSEKVRVTFNGWDGRSYNGESRKMNVWTCDKLPGKKFVYKRQGGFFSCQGGHYKIDAMFEITDRMILDQETGEYNPKVEYYCSEEVPFTRF